jgi:hypothetical protein
MLVEVEVRVNPRPGIESFRRVRYWELGLNLQGQTPCEKGVQSVRCAGASMRHSGMWTAGSQPVRERFSWRKRVECGDGMESPIMMRYHQMGP